MECSSSVRVKLLRCLVGITSSIVEVHLRFCLTVVAISLYLCVLSCQVSYPKGSSLEGGKPLILPDHLYRHAWKLVKDNYYDQSFNGQPWSIWERRYIGKLKDIADAHLAIATMISSLGDAGTYFTASRLVSDDKEAMPNLAGVGLVLTHDNKYISIKSVLPNTSASASVLKAGDRLLTVDRDIVAGKRLAQVVDAIRGQENTSVTITARDTKGKLKEVRLVRNLMTIRLPLKVQTLDREVSYVRISSLLSSAIVQDVKEALKGLNTKCLILDVRENAGGTLAAAAELASLLLAEPFRVLFSTIDVDGVLNAHSSGDSAAGIRLSLVVLIDRTTDAGALMLAAALQENGRALLVGEQVFGNDLIQSNLKLEDGSAIRMSIARWLTPKDNSVSKDGLSPNVEVKVSPAESAQAKGPWWKSGKILDPSRLTDKQLLHAWDQAKHYRNDQRKGKLQMKMMEDR